MDSAINFNCHSKDFSFGYMKIYATYFPPAQLFEVSVCDKIKLHVEADILVSHISFPISYSLSLLLLISLHPCVPQDGCNPCFAILKIAYAYELFFGAGCRLPGSLARELLHRNI